MRADETAVLVLPDFSDDSRMGKPVVTSLILHSLLLFLLASVASNVTMIAPLEPVKVLEINVIGKEDLALRGTGNDWAVGPLADKTMLAQRAKLKGPVLKGNTPKISRGVRNAEAEDDSVPDLKAAGPLFSSHGRHIGAGVGRTKIYVSASAVKLAAGGREKGAPGEGLVGIPDGPVDLGAARGAGGTGGGTGNFLAGGEGSVNGGDILSRRGRPILAEYPLASDNAMRKGAIKKYSDLPLPSDDFFSIVGPLSGRKILKMALPRYPRWAEEQGLEAQVAVRLTVTAKGRVKPDLVIERTSGYPDLDNLVLEAVRKMLFSPLSGGARHDEWGVAAFNFKLSKR